MPHNKRFTTDEINFIKTNYTDLTIVEMATILCRTPKSVRGKVERLGLPLRSLDRNTAHLWTDSELEILKNNFQLPDYELHKMLPSHSAISICRKRLELGLRKIDGSPYINGDYLMTYKGGQKIFIHKQVVSDSIGRPLTKDERVHHIDGNKLNNELDNLYLCSDRAAHGKVHSSLQEVAFQLVRKGIIKFDSESGTYHLVE